MNTMNEIDQKAARERVKEIRTALNFNQRDFSLMLSLADSYIGGVESGRIKVNDRLIKLIASSFNVSEEYLRKGCGSMFCENYDTAFSRLAGVFKELPPKYQEAVLKVAEVFAKQE